MRLLLTLVLSVFGLAQVGVAFVVGFSPGEGIKEFAAKGRPLELRLDPTRAAPVVLRIDDVEPGQVLPYDSVQFQTIAPGRIAVLRSTEIAGTLFGDVQVISTAEYYFGDVPTTTWHVAAGDTLDHLQYSREGTCFVRWGGEVLEAALCPTVQADEAESVRLFDFLSEPVTRWWIRVSAPTVGWLEVDPDVVEVSVSF